MQNMSFMVNPFDKIAHANNETAIQERPYNRCLNCVYIGRRCDGPNFFAMDIASLSEWCALRKEYLRAQDSRWTNAYIAEQAKVSKISVDRFLSGKADDIRLSTISGIIKVLVNGSWGQYPCAMVAFTQDKETANAQELAAACEAAKAECERMRAEMERADSDAQKQINFMKEQIKIKDDQIAEKNKHLSERAAFMVRKDTTIKILAASLAVFAAVSLVLAGIIIF